MILIGKVVKAQGVKGEIKVFPITPDPSRYELLKEISLSKKDRLENLEDAGSAADRKLFSIKNIKYLSAKKFVILKLQGVETREDAELLKGYNIFIPDEYQLELTEDQFFIHDLIGLEVFDEKGNHVGVVKNVMDTQANDVFEIEDSQGNEIMVPFIEDAGCDVDLENRRLIVNSDFIVS